MSLCECGCGGEAKPGNRFIHGHNRQDRTTLGSTIYSENSAI